MESPDVGQWQGFYAALATSVAALLGLLFVATSLHLEKLTRDSLLQRRSRNLLIIMNILFVQSLAVLVPQEATYLGAEVLALNAIIVSFPLTVIYTLRRDGIPLPVVQIAAGVLASFGAAIGGLLLCVHWPWSLYVVAAMNVLLVFVMITNAWSLMLGLWRTEVLRADTDNA